LSRRPRGAGHLVAHEAREQLDFVGWYFEDEFVVNLEQHPCLQFLGPQPVMGREHRLLDEVGGRSLNDRVDRRSFR